MSQLLSINTCSLWLWYVVHHVCVSLTHVDLICLEFMDSGPLKHLLMPFSEMRKFSYFLTCLFSSGQGSTSESHRLGEPFHHWATPTPTRTPSCHFLKCFFLPMLFLHYLPYICYTHISISGVKLLMSSLFLLSVFKSAVTSKLILGPFSPFFL